MYATGKRLRRGAMALALLLGLASTVRAEEQDRPETPRTDIVFLFDVSGSMRKRNALNRAQNLLIDVVEKVVVPGTQTAVIPFGTGVHRATVIPIADDPKGARAGIASIRSALRQLNGRDSYTYLYQAIAKGLETLMEFKAKKPGNARHIILISDGKQVTRRGEGGMSLRDILDRFVRLGFKPGEDWYIWYAHFGEADDRLARALENSGAGQVVSLDDLPTLSWAYTRIDKNAVDLGAHAPGAWKQTVRLVAETEQDGVGREVFFSVAADGLPDGMALSVSPKSARLAGKKTQLELEISCQGARGGNFKDLASLLVDTRGSLHWIENRKIDLRFKVALPRIDCGAHALEVGRLAPGTETTRSLALIPSAAAAATGAQVEMKVEGVESGHRVELDRRRVAADGRREVSVRVAVPADAKPGNYESRVVLRGGSDVEIVPGTVRVSYRVGYGRVTVGEDKVAFAPVLAGRNASTAVTLTPDKETARNGVEIGVEVVDAPKGITLKVPARLRLDGRGRLPVSLRVPAETESGAYRAKLRFKAPDGVLVEPAEIPVTFQVKELAALMLPAVLDLGDVPASRAREIRGRLEMAVGEHHMGAELELVAADGKTAVEPGAVTLQQGTETMTLRLRTAEVKLGKRSCKLEAYLTRSGVRKLAGTIDVRWRVLESFFRVKDWVPPSAATTGSGDAAGTLLVETSGDLEGRRLRIASLFEGLASGMTVALETDEIELEGGMQTIPVTLRLENARAGRYKGRLGLGFARTVEGVKTPAPLQVTLDVSGAVIYAAVEGGLHGMQAGSERELTLILTATAAPAGTTVRLHLERGDLPAGVLSDVPATVDIEKADGVTRVPLRFKAESRVATGTWSPRLAMTSKDPNVTVSPASVTLQADVRAPVVEVRTEETGIDPLWLALGAGVLLILGLVVFLMMRRKQPGDLDIPDMVIPEDEQQEVPVDDLLADDDDLLVLEGISEDDE